MSESINRRAGEWLARFDRGNTTPQDRDAFDRWRAADARHATAYERFEALWMRLDGLQTLRADLTEVVDPDALVPLSPARHPRLPAPWLAAAGVAALACVTALTVVLVSWPTSEQAVPTQRYVTSVGGHERAVMDDGSVAELNTDTELHVALSDAERRVELKRGEASFEVAQDPRPFLVTAGDVTVRAVGTVFNVRLRDDLVEILVVEGKVAVGALIVQAGEAAVSAPARLDIQKLPSEHVDRALAWQKGMLSFENVSLTEAAEEFNRYNARRLVVTDPAIGNLRIGGYFRATNLEGFVRVLEENLAIQATRETTEIRLSRLPPSAE